jgi:hypothetical protein
MRPVMRLLARRAAPSRGHCPHPFQIFIGIATHVCRTIGTVRHVQLDPNSASRRRIAMGAWLVLAALAFAKAATSAGAALQFVFVAIGCVLLLCFWAFVRWAP